MFEVFKKQQEPSVAEEERMRERMAWNEIEKAAGSQIT